MRNRSRDRAAGPKQSGPIRHVADLDTESAAIANGLDYLFAHKAYEKHSFQKAITSQQLQLVKDEWATRDRNNSLWHVLCNRA